MRFRLVTQEDKARYLRRCRVYYVVVGAVGPALLVVNNHFSRDPSWQVWLFAAIVAMTAAAAIWYIQIRLRDLQEESE